MAFISCAVSLSQDVMRNEVSSITGEGGGTESRAGNPVRVRDCTGSCYSNHGYRLAMEQRVL